MPKLTVLLLSALLLSACSTMPQSAAGDSPEYFASLSEQQAEGELEKVLADLKELDDEIRSAEVRRDAARMREGSDASKDIGAEGAEAELDSLQVRKGALINRQVQ